MEPVEKLGQRTGACTGICMGNPIGSTNSSRALGELQLLNELKITKHELLKRTLNSGLATGDFGLLI